MTKEEAKALKKASKQKIKVDFERTNAWERFRLKFLTFNFFRTVVMKVFRLVLLLGISYVILYPFISKIFGSFMTPKDLVDVTVKLIPKYPSLDIYEGKMWAKIEKEDGDTVYYVEATNEFVVLSTDGYIRTYFLPDSGKRYFDRQ